MMATAVVVLPVPGGPWMSVSCARSWTTAPGGGEGGGRCVRHEHSFIHDRSGGLLHMRLGAVTVGGQTVEMPCKCGWAERERAQGWEDSAEELQMSQSLRERTKGPGDSKWNDPGALNPAMKHRCNGVGKG